ncbi:MAG: phosphotransferase [Ruminococcus sp.]|nr:phosphotransferase [Ruminococcus sp.]
MRTEFNDGTLVIYLSGRIDSANAAQYEKEIFSALEAYDAGRVEFDASMLGYISSAGLRILMAVRKSIGDSFCIVNVSGSVYDIFETTGFTHILNVRKTLRIISVGGCKKIGSSKNAAVYRLNPETIVKVYKGDDASPERIEKSRETARQVFMHDIPTVIAFDMVRVGMDFGVVYEMLSAEPVGAMIKKDPDGINRYGSMIASLMKKLHSTEFEKGILPDARDAYINDTAWLHDNGWYDDAEYERVNRLIEDIPYRNTFIHSYLHPGNIMVHNDELVLIDVDDAATGHPVIELAGMYNGYHFGASDDNDDFSGLDQKELSALWEVILSSYLETSDPEKLADADRTIKAYSLLRQIRVTAADEALSKRTRKSRVEKLKKELFDACDTLVPVP